jgi:hypothetical protein
MNTTRIDQPHSAATRETLRSRPRFLVSGVMEFWSTGVSRPVGIAPRFRGVGNAFNTDLTSIRNNGRSNAELISGNQRGIRI